MKPLLILSILFAFFFNNSNAQYVDIPDLSFKEFLTTKYPECFNTSGQMDTTCKSITDEDSLIMHFSSSSFTPIQTNLDGIQYFKNLKLLIFDDYSYHVLNIPGLSKKVREINFSRVLQITSLTNFPDSLEKITLFDCFNVIMPSLPAGLKEMFFFDYNAASLPKLPDDLIRLVVNARQLIELPALPDKLKSLQISGCTFPSLPDLPVSLDTLYCKSNQLTALPTLPVNLRYLDCSDNKLNFLPSLSEKLEYLDCSSNDSLKNLPELPQKLRQLNVQLSGLKSLPPLPSGLTELRCSYNKLLMLPVLPDSLIYLNCGGNQIELLPSIPSSLISLDVQGNKIHSLPNLPNSLKELICGSNPLVNLSQHLPDSLISLYCNDDSLTSLPPLPMLLKQLICSNNFLTNLPSLPSLGYLDCRNNNIYCLPRLPRAGYVDTKYFIDIEKVKCVPNKSQGIKFMIPNPTPGPYYDYWVEAPPIELCNPTNNVNHCQSFPTITGSVFIDNNRNGIKDSNEFYIPGVKVETSNGNITFTNSNGYFETGTDSLGNCAVTVYAPNYYVLMPPLTSYNFTTYDTIVYKEYALQAAAVKDSLNIKLSALTPAARPGFSFPYLVNYANAGTTTLASNIVFNYDNTKLSYDSSNNTSVINDGTKLVLNAGLLVPGQQGNFIAYFKIKTTAAIGDSSLNKVSIINNNITASDSSKAFIRGSYDPNDKEATPQLALPQLTNEAYINYTIHFQNVGNDTAFNIVIADTLSSKLQAGTLLITGSSHPCKVTINHNNVFFEFLNILLPDININEPKSHGFISFKIRPQSNVPINSTITNKAAIYFDYNSPVITNNASTFVYGYTTLQLSLMNFSATVKTANETTILWNTINESGSEKFIIEQSENGIDFKSIATVNAKGTNFNTYNVTVDDHTSALVYYRLAVINNDGDLKYSAIVKLYKTSNNSLFTVFPDQRSRSLIISSSDKELDDSEAYLINVQGALVKKLMIKRGITTLKVPDLASGLYYLNTKKGTYKILLQ